MVLGAICCTVAERPCCANMPLSTGRSWAYAVMFVAGTASTTFCPAAVEATAWDASGLAACETEDGGLAGAAVEPQFASASAARPISAGFDRVSAIIAAHRTSPVENPCERTMPFPLERNLLCPLWLMAYIIVNMPRKLQFRLSPRLTEVM